MKNSFVNILGEKLYLFEIYLYLPVYLSNLSVCLTIFLYINIFGVIHLAKQMHSDLIDEFQEG